MLTLKYCVTTSVSVSRARVLCHGGIILFVFAQYESRSNFEQRQHKIQHFIFRDYFHLIWVKYTILSFEVGFWWSKRKRWLTVLCPWFSEDSTCLLERNHKYNEKDKFRTFTLKNHSNLVSEIISSNSLGVSIIHAINFRFYLILFQLNLS